MISVEQPIIEIRFIKIVTREGSEKAFDIYVHNKNLDVEKESEFKFSVYKSDVEFLEETLTAYKKWLESSDDAPIKEWWKEVKKEHSKDNQEVA